MADETKKLCTCGICNRLSRKATALRNCNHIFCWKCINGKITKHDWKCCPVCYVEFGPDPLLRLRRDHPLLESLRTNGLFPAQKDLEMIFESDEETSQSENSNNEENENSYDEDTDEDSDDESEDSDGDEINLFEDSNDESSEYEISEDENTEADNSEDEGVPVPMDTESETDSY